MHGAYGEQNRVQTRPAFPMSKSCLVLGLKSYGCVVWAYSCETFDKQHWHDIQLTEQKIKFNSVSNLWVVSVGTHMFNACLFNALLSGRAVLNLSAITGGINSKRHNLIESPTLCLLPAVVLVDTGCVFRAWLLGHGSIKYQIKLSGLEIASHLVSEQTWLPSGAKHSNSLSIQFDISHYNLRIVSLEMSMSMSPAIQSITRSLRPALAEPREGDALLLSI